jgi:Raf kinase inhibitor-like YbhB/YbcL family protein
MFFELTPLKRYNIMSNAFSITIEGWEHGAAIPEKFALGKQDSDSHVALTDNINPAISWADAPAGTKSFAIICNDPDVPSSGEDVNQEGKVVPADLPRIDFYHWVLVDVPVSVAAINEGEASTGVTPKGKSFGQKPYGVAGINDYTAWFDGDADMGGDYGDYDGPCPPWNDSIMHHYHFTVYALDVASVGLSGNFDGREAVAAIKGHVLAESTVMGTYTLNPEL